MRGPSAIAELLVTMTETTTMEQCHGRYGDKSSAETSETSSQPTEHWLVELQRETQRLKCTQFAVRRLSTPRRVDPAWQ